MRFYTVRNHLITRSFVKEVLRYCRNRVKFLIDPSMHEEFSPINRNDIYDEIQVKEDYLGIIEKIE